MPFVCCVPNCRSHYNANEKVSIFGFPKDPNLRENWLRLIHQVSESSRICRKHFSEEFIIREDVITRPDGTILRVAREKVKLLEDAYPTTFENQPSYLSTTLPTKRKTPSVRNSEMKVRKLNEEEVLEKADEIIKFDELSKNIFKKIGIFLHYFTLKLYREKLIIFVVNEGNLNFEIPCIEKGIIIYNDLKFKFFHKNIEIIDNKELNDIVGKTKICSSWSIMLKVLEFIKNYDVPDVKSEFKLISKIMSEMEKNPYLMMKIHYIKLNLSGNKLIC